eukprot:TRINITY_DN4131_c0_g3_i2.p1 TRINITY_DN4131_c0_g3~~TRINITY_DN4131_c0_g3_i2.p1  ORF type:complete len:166 (-),score=31.21 TRINITY_DN4131_c0_g3_i2:53-550(-)
MKKSVTSRRVTLYNEYIGKPRTHITCVSIGPNSCSVFCTGDDDRNVCIWTLDPKNPFKVFSAHSSEITSVAFSPDERVCASGSQGGTVLVWDLEEQKTTASLKEHRVACTALAVPPVTSPLLATGSQDTNVKVWDMRAAKSIYTLKGHEDKINTCLLYTSPSPRD